MRRIDGVEYNGKNKLSYDVCMEYGMPRSEESRNIVVDLCRDVNTSMKLVVKHCDALLEKVDGHLNDKQTTDTGIMRKRGLRLLSLTGEISQSTREETHLNSDYLVGLIYDLRSLVDLILNFAQINLHEVRGTLNDKQRETVRYIYRICQQLMCTLDDYRVKVTKDPLLDWWIDQGGGEE